MGMCRHKNKFNWLYIQSLLVISVFCIDSTLSHGYRRRAYTRQELRQDVNCPEPTGQFPHPRYCDRFLNCWDGDFHVEQCPGSLVFNEKIKACDWRRNVDCSGKDGDESAQQAPDPSMPVNNEPLPVTSSTTTTTTTERVPPSPTAPPSSPPQSSSLPPVLKPKPKPAFGLKPPTTSSPGNIQNQGQAEEQNPSGSKPPVVVQLKPKPQFRPSTEKPTQSPIEIGSLPTDEPFSPPDSEISPSESEMPSGPDGKPPKPTTPDTDPGFIPSLPAHFPQWPTVKCPISQGILPVSGHCDAVVVCLSGVGHLLRCPHGHSFDSTVGSCRATRDGQDCNKSPWFQKIGPFSSQSPSHQFTTPLVHNPQVQFVYVPQAVFSTQDQISRMIPLQQQKHSLSSFFNL